MCRIRIVVVCPWFIDTAILPTATRVILAGIPLTPISRVAGAIVNAATDPNWDTSGATYSIPDDGSVIRIERQELAVGIYKILNDRVHAGMRYVFLLRIHDWSLSCYDITEYSMASSTMPMS